MVLCLILAALQQGAHGADEVKGVRVDAARKAVLIDAKIAPRKLEHLKEVYPIEVIASWPHPKGKKAHETVVTIEASPSAVHTALVELGLKPGKPLQGESEKPPEGPEVLLSLEVPGPGGIPRRLTMDRVLVDRRTGKPFPRSVQWRFTGSAEVKPDPTSDKTVYGADQSGTLAVIFPVSDQTVLQTSLTMKYEKFMKLDTNVKALPEVGTPVKLVIEVPPGK